MGWLVAWRLPVRRAPTEVSVAAEAVMGASAVVAEEVTRVATAGESPVVAVRLTLAETRSRWQELDLAMAALA